MANTIRDEVVFMGTSYVHTKLIAHDLNISTYALNKWIRNNSDFYNNLEYIYKYKNGKHTVLYMSKKGYIAYVATKGSNNDPTQNTRFRVAKTQIVEKSISVQEQNSEMRAVMDDPIIAMRLHQIKLEKRIEALEQRQGVALSLLPEITEEVPDITPRTATVQIVQKYAKANGEDYRDTWNYLFDQYVLRFHVDIRKRAKTANLSTPEYAEKFGYIGKLYALAIKLFT